MERNVLIICLLFIDGNLNRQKYSDLIVEDIYLFLVENFVDQMENDNLERLWCTQDGAPAHRADFVIELLQDMFPRHVIFRVARPPKIS